MRLSKKILTALVLLGFYFVAAALADEMGYGQSHEGSPHLVLCHSKKKKQAPKPTFHPNRPGSLSGVWSCPAGWSVYASERELVEGKKTFVHCVK